MTKDIGSNSGFALRVSRLNEVQSVVRNGARLSLPTRETHQAARLRGAK
eukprot:CAMPEP_0184487604 /NCGR_PEP_ID=MMETSP0113_2-20130426/10219_1 /TAXON_ID=91329 /ORGANISM="Norrisiella sphaerica, Strain BC52" /LENGTH=48 /DNA_ID= /DNA_START= /DNA_END= /DNA_ORIENTATION=